MKKIIFLGIIGLTSILNTAKTQEFKIVKEGNFYGIKTQDTFCLPAIYDEIVPIENATNAFHIKKNNLYGLSNLYLKSHIDPISLTKLKFEGATKFHKFFDEIYYSYTSESKQKCFVSYDGKYKLNCNPETIFPKKEGDFYYLFGLDEVDSKNVAKKSINSKFLHLQKTDLSAIYIAKGLSGKYGLINSSGDTLLPFENSSIDFFEYDGEGNDYLILGRNGKKALYDFNENKLIPFYFDEISRVHKEMHSNIFMTKSNGKFGLFCTELIELLPTEYDKIELKTHEDDNGFYICYIAQKNGKFLVQTGKGYFFYKGESVLSTKEYDLIDGQFGLLKKDSSYEFYSLYTHELVKTVKDSDYKK